MCWQRASSSSACGSVTEELASSRRLLKPSASVGPSASRRPQSRAVASSSAAETTLFTRPIEAASFASIRSRRTRAPSPSAPDAARQQPRGAAVERETALREDLGEARAIAREDQVAREREPHRDPDAHAVDHRERRLGQAREAQDDVADHAHLGHDRLHGPPGETDARFVAGEIGAREKLPPAPVTITARASGSIASSVNTPSSSFHATASIAFFFALGRA